MYIIVYGSLTLLLFVHCSPGYDEVGCYKDTDNPAIPTLEGKDSILDGSYSSRTNPIAKCAVAAMRAGYRMFAVQNGGWCAASATALETYDKYGKSTACKGDGEGGPWANRVYELEGKSRNFHPYSRGNCFLSAPFGLTIPYLINYKVRWYLAQY